MNILTSIFNFSNALEFFSSLMADYGQILWIVFMILAFLNCFFGYPLRKLWSVLIGFITGAVTGLGLFVYLDQSTKLCLVASLGLGLILAVIAFLLYRIGLFLLTGGLTMITLWYFTGKSGTLAMLIFLAAGIIVGILTLALERPVIILATAIGGACGAAFCINHFLGLPSRLLLLIIGILLAVAGLLFQFKPWRGDEYWDEVDEMEDEKLRNKERIKKKKHRAARKKRKIERRNRKKEKDLKKKHKKKMAQEAQKEAKINEEYADYIAAGKKRSKGAAESERYTWIEKPDPISRQSVKKRKEEATPSGKPAFSLYENEEMDQTDFSSILGDTDTLSKKIQRSGSSRFEALEQAQASADTSGQTAASGTAAANAASQMPMTEDFLNIQLELASSVAAIMQEKEQTPPPEAGNDIPSVSPFEDA